MSIHHEHPFADAEADRDPVRRFRGRLVAPVTVITSGDADAQAGLTVSSLMVAEGEPPSLRFLVGTTTDLAQAILATESFVVHILAVSQQRVADVFAGVRPHPGGPFAGWSTEASNWGPVFSDLPDRAYCSLVGAVESTYHHLIESVIDRVELSDLIDPLAYFRGRYRRIGPLGPGSG